MSTKPVPLIHIGYGHGLTQTATLLSIHLPVPPEFDKAQLDRWLAMTFELTCPPRRIKEGAVVGEDQDRAADMAWRVLQLAGLLLRTIKAPIFDPGRIMAVENDADKDWLFKVSVATAFARVAPLPVMQKVFHLATDAVIRLSQEKNQANHNHPLAEEIYRTFIEPASQQMAGGGSMVSLLQAAYDLNIPFQYIAGSVYQLGWGVHAQLIDRSSLQSDSGIGGRTSHNKFFAASMLRASGFPAPVHKVVFSERDARSAADNLDKPLVVKPVDRERGEGVSMDISDSDAAVEAAKEAARLSRGVLIEQQVPGVCHRLLVAHGKLLYAVKRLPKSVKGDGTRTVAQLIEQANARENAKLPWQRLKPFPSDQMAQDSLAVAGMTLQSVPKQGEYAPLRRFSTITWGGVVEEVTNTIHPDNLDLALRAAALFRLTVAGIDLITPDITVPWHENGAILNEVNYTPLFPTNSPVSPEYLSTFIRDVFPNGDGRIPVDVYVGGEQALEQARNRHKEITAGGTACFLSSNTLTLDTTGAVRQQLSTSLFDRITALLQDPQVEHLVLIVQNDELAQLGLPVDRINKLAIVDHELQAWRSGQPLSTEGFTVLHDLLKSYSLEHSGSGDAV